MIPQLTIESRFILKALTKKHEHDNKINHHLLATLPLENAWT